ncbi:hypothetical protein HBI60_176640 [Parastagonospora nodorum]|nr:hypothetical protein HBH52_199230 [Parastagonospora nodorum]KAH5632557.1 hypothetical protein HBI51_188290 [Parastagonospora nodorum]KAH6390770.1 hypothetical protein HBI60_176640 [Parastagonospora nodorum]KAH6538780.1 hypothetical protein HBI07_117110 [Parastagonospora nodorum]
MYRSIEGLNGGSGAKFWRLMSHSDDDPINSRIRANGFGVKCHVEHDCRPNATYSCEEETLSHYVHAQKMRLEELGDWNFTCACSACAAHPAIVAESDARIEQIHELGWELVDWINDDSKATPEMAKTLTSLHQQENLQTDIGRAYKHAVEVYGGYGKKYEAMKYARLAVEMLYLSKGFSHLDVKKMKEMANNRDGMNHEASSFSS